MSHRKKGREINPPGPRPLVSITITMFTDNKIGVSGFPNNLLATLNLMHEGELAVVRHFIEEKIIRLDS